MNLCAQANPVRERSGVVHDIAQWKMTVSHKEPKNDNGNGSNHDDNSDNDNDNNDDDDNNCNDNGNKNNDDDDHDHDGDKTYDDDDNDSDERSNVPLYTPWRAQPIDHTGLLNQDHSPKVASALEWYTEAANTASALLSSAGAAKGSGLGESGQKGKA
ncbi:hypothetical protein K474DRAFT_1680781 [Panus rudis PR-1116 ss-1]|nr:hypothetical protein K474DRAFT_1680781 [Panus rudis PR-1116 ss-1]